MDLIIGCLLSACQTLSSGEKLAQAAPIPALAPETPLVTETLQAVITRDIVLTTDLHQETEPETGKAEDLWGRMRSRFTLEPASHARVIQELNWYKKNPKYIARIEQRAEPYLYFILEELEKRQMPGEIALLPAVESAYQPFAYSPGRAAGLWQFIPSTGKSFGLKQNWWYDGRRDIVESTRAALDYLQRLHRQFDGDWELALASYNSGAGTVRRAERRNLKQGKETDYWSLSLPRETRFYVPRLLALTEIFREPEKYSITLRDLPDKPYFERVDIGSQLDLAMAAEMSDLTIQELYRLNPGFNRWATDPDGPHRLNLPLESVDGFLQQLAQLPEQKRLKWKRYRIKSGDSLSVIAKKHGTTTKILRQVNKLSSNKIRAGKHLLIPVSSKSLDHYAFSASERKSRIQNKKRKGLKQHYVVKRGDNLWGIARAHNLNHKQLAKWNGMAPGDPIKPGQKLVLWIQNTSASQLPALNLGPGNQQSRISYKVRRGDSLSRIADRFRVSVAELRKWNHLPGKYLQPGQKLSLYVDVTEQTL
jgi:membrane-bound lytic murein transglycosylase D